MGFPGRLPIACCRIRVQGFRQALLVACFMLLSGEALLFKWGVPVTPELPRPSDYNIFVPQYALHTPSHDRLGLSELGFTHAVGHKGKYYRWKRGRIGVSSAGKFPTISQMSGIIDAIKSANQAVGLDLFRFSGVSSDFFPVDIQILITSDIAVGANATTWVHFDQLDNGSPSILADIRILPSLNDQLFKKVMLHELGHVLGFQHSKDPLDLMYDGKRKNPADLPGDFSTREKRTLRLLYQLGDSAGWQE